MANFVFEVTPLARSSGRRATSSAAYRSGERIRDERSGRVYDHTQRTDVMHKEIVLPSRFEGAQLSWTRDRSVLWNAAERAESRKNSRVGREYMVALPHELNAQQRLVLTQRLAALIADRHNVLVDVAIHAPRPDGDARNYHAHLLATTREVTPKGLGAKSVMELSDWRRRQLGLSRSSEEIRSLREQWAGLTNEAFRAAGIASRVDHRSLEAQGIDREPFPHIPIGMIHLERRGLRSRAAERIRERFRKRAAIRSAQPAQAERTLPGPGSLRAAFEDLKRKSLEAWSSVRTALAPQPNVPQHSLVDDRAEAWEAEFNQRAARAWSMYPVVGKMRENQAEGYSVQEPDITLQRARERDNDFAL